jgi:hypothetical protein
LRDGYAARLRRVTWPRVLFMVGLIAVGLVLTRALGRQRPHVKEAEAVAIARQKIDFKPQGHTIRLVQRGIPPHAFWAVSFWIRRTGGGYKRVTVVLVDGGNGRVVEVRRST